MSATFSVRSARRRSQLEALLSLSEELPRIGGVSFRIAHLQVFEQATHPLVCNAERETDKSEAAVLLRQLVELKRQEVALMRQGVAQAATASSCDNTLLQAIALRLGVTLA